MIEEIMQHDVIFGRVNEDCGSRCPPDRQIRLDRHPRCRCIGHVGRHHHARRCDRPCQEQTEDTLAFGGVSRDADANEATWSAGQVNRVRRRIGWLLFLFLAGTLTKYVSRTFQQHTAIPDLVDFIPLMIGTGGNVGSQLSAHHPRRVAR